MIAWKPVSSLKTMIMTLIQLALTCLSSVQKAWEKDVFDVSSAEVFLM